MDLALQRVVANCNKRLQGPLVTGLFLKAFFFIRNGLPRDGFHLGSRSWVSAVGFIDGASAAFPFFRTAANRDRAATNRDKTVAN